MLAVRTLLAEKVFEPRDAQKREVVFRSQLLSQPTISWVAFGWPDGTLFAGHKAGDGVIEMMEISPDRKLRISRYEFVGNDLQAQDQLFEETKYSVTEQEWFRMRGRTTTNSGRRSRRIQEANGGGGLLGADRDRQEAAGVIAIIIELTRVSNFLSQLTVGKSAGAFILERDGKVVASPIRTPTRRWRSKPIIRCFRSRSKRSGTPTPISRAKASRSTRRVTRDGKAYQAVLTPISFPGWSLVTVVPESEFLGPVQMTIRNLLIGLAVLIVFAGLLSAWLAQRLIAAPLIKVVNEIRHVERFDLDKVQRHPSRLTEIENLSGAIGDMAQGLAAFRKYIPADLVSG